jgi:hypothetical protein
LTFSLGLGLSGCSGRVINIANRNHQWFRLGHRFGLGERFRFSYWHRHYERLRK